MRHTRITTKEGKTIAAKRVFTTDKGLPISNIHVNLQPGTNIYHLSAQVEDKKLILPLGSCSQGVAMVMADDLTQIGHLPLTIPSSILSAFKKAEERVTAEVELVTPIKALEYLSTNIFNRPIAPNRIRRYARNMADGKWILTGEGIIFDLHGRLIDGQNRLWAVVEARTPAPLLVVRGVITESQKVIDDGLSRNVGDWLSYAGDFSNCPGGKFIGTIMSCIISLGTGVNSLADHTMIVETSHMYRNDLVWLQSWILQDDHNYLRSRDLVAGLVVFHHIFPEEAEKFVSKFVGGTGTVTDPIHVLRQYFTARRGHGHYCDSVLVRRLRLFQAARAFIENERFYPNSKADDFGFPRLPVAEKTKKIDQTHVNNLLAFFSNGDRGNLVPNNRWREFQKKGSVNSTRFKIETKDVPELRLKKR